MKLTLTKKEKEAKDTYSFEFRPEKEIDFLPGQYMYLTLPEMKGEDARGATRDLTISSSPTEGEDLSFTTRIRTNSVFKQELKALEKGSVVEASGPSGTFILDENENGKHMLIAGGIGITPFRSIVKYHTDKELPAQLTLIYSNSTPEEITFKKDFKEREEQNPNFSLHMTITKPKKNDKWKGLTGRIDGKMIKKIMTDEKLKIKSTTFWLCGPPKMIDAMEEVLENLGVRSRNVRSEKFSGY